MCTKVSFKITIRNSHVLIDIPHTLNMKPEFPVGLFEMMIVLK
jgi:hypothetical protein